MGILFITGATGLLGSQMAKTLLNNGWQLRASIRPESSKELLLSDQTDQKIDWRQGSLFDLDFIDTCLENVDAVVHAAALVSFNPKKYDDLLRHNVELTAGLVNGCLVKDKSPRFCQISSVAAVGENSARPGEAIDETNMWSNEEPYTGYSLSKHLAEREVWRAAQEGLEAFAVNPSVIVSGASWHRSSGQLFDYVRKGKKLYTPGYINHTDVSDVTAAVTGLLKTDIRNERFIINAGAVPYKVFFDKIAQHLGTQAPSKKAPRWQAEIAWRANWLSSLVTGSEPLITKETARNAFRQTVYDGGKINSVLPNFTYKTLEESIKKACQELQNGGRLK